MNTRKSPIVNWACEGVRCDGVSFFRAVPLMRIAGILLVALFGLDALSAKEPANSAKPAGLVLHYTFDARTGKTVENQVSDKHAGQSVGALFQSDGAAGRALSVRKGLSRFGYVETANHEELNSPKFTVAAWVKLRRKDSNGSVVCKHDWPDGKSRGFVLRCYAAERINFTIGAGGWKSTDGTSRVAANQWVHVAGTFDGKHIRVFVNGQMEGRNEIKQAYTPSTLPIRIGHSAFTKEEKRKFDGQIDDVMIWNRALSEQELRDVVTAQKRS